MNRITILVLKSDDTVAFEDTLASVLANRPSGCQVVAVCPGGYEDPYDLQDEVRFYEVPAGSSLAAAINQLLPTIDSELVHLIAAGLRAEEGWVEAAEAVFAAPEVVAAAPWIISSDPERLLAAGIRRTWTGRRALAGGGRRLQVAGRLRRVVGPAWSAAFYRVAALRQAGGFDETVGDWQMDLDMALSLRAHRGRLVAAPDARLTGCLPHSDAASDFQRGRQMERLFWKHVDSLAALVTHPISWLIETVAPFPKRAGLVELVGRIVAVLEIPLAARYYRRKRQQARPQLSLVCSGAAEGDDVRPRMRSAA